ncbi:MAG: primosomal protein N', partial [Actinomycetota bacterium]|nr:primosomal protein N' [Actinomycetota bacterium]
MTIAHVIVDIPTREISAPFDYAVPESMDDALVGVPVAVDFHGRIAVGYVVGHAEESSFAQLKPLLAVLGEPCFDEVAVASAMWVAHEYVCPLADALRLFLPPGGSFKIVKDTPERDSPGTAGFRLVRSGATAIDDRWASLAEESSFTPRATATMQRAVLDALSAGPVRVPELTAQLGQVSSALAALDRAGAVVVEKRRRMRHASVREVVAPRHARLTGEQEIVLATLLEAATAGGEVVLLDGVTGSGKTEVYLQAIERVLEQGGGAIVLVPEISLTPQTVGRFRARFGDLVAVLHSRLSDGERFDQWDLVRAGAARVVVGARSALFAPVSALRLIIIDEEHESSYKQASAPRYHARDVAAHLVGLRSATLLLGSATPSMEAREVCARGEWKSARLSKRVEQRPMPTVEVVDMTREFEDGHRSMFSRRLTRELESVAERGSKAVLFLNRRGFASFLLCRECGYVPSCDNCA